MLAKTFAAPSTPLGAASEFVLNFPGSCSSWWFTWSLSDFWSASSSLNPDLAEDEAEGGESGVYMCLTGACGMRTSNRPLAARPMKKRWQYTPVVHGTSLGCANLGCLPRL